MQIKGRDIATESYRIASEVDGRWIVALLPERLAADDWRPGTRPSHQQAYEWIAQHRPRIEAAIAALARGSQPRRAPFDQMTLLEED
ncbi:hypothetical protein SAMN04490248_10674 [Salinihabitans flavidus]|uniref:DUF1488 domain-containing protein n=1 Tax=Salinihabitans flavidus TaxID=569882 RepID=A0A1H8QAJ0_9RHOB|nr:hypothetical protein [Salinihabitans flavidus]SEO51021.1 hypothetical protein SAMN04490248_10674 [Salinihabitans flavidus]